MKKYLIKLRREKLQGKDHKTKRLMKDFKSTDAKKNQDIRER